MSTTAADQVTALERKPPGDPSFTAAAVAAEQAIAAERDAATAALFPTELHPVPADAIQEYAWRTGRLTAVNYGPNLAEVHRRAVRTHPALAAILRSPEALDDVAAAAASCAVPASFDETHQAAGERAAAAARAAYAVAIAGQLAGSEHELARPAAALLACEDLAARVAAVRAQHEQHERDEAARAAAEKRAAEDAANQAADAAAAELELQEVLRRHGLPADLAARGGEFVATHRARCLLLATARRRLNTTSVDAIRLNRGHGSGLYGCKDLARGISDDRPDELRAILDQLDRAESR